MAPTNHQNNIFYLSAPSQREREWIARYPLGWCIKQNIHTSTYLSVYIAITCSSALPLFLFQHLTTLFLCYSPPPVCSFVTMSLHSLSLRSLCLPFLCYFVFYILCPLCHSGFCLFVTLSLHTQPLMSLCHYVFRSSVTLSFTYSVPYVFMSLWLLFIMYILAS